MGKILFLALIQLGVLNSSYSDHSKESEFKKKAKELSEKLLIIDTHIDLPYRLKNKWADISKRTESGHFDYPRALEGGLNSAFMSIFVPARYEGKEGSVELVDSLIDMVEYLSNMHPDKFSIAYSSDDVLNKAGTDIITLPLGIENGTPLEGSFDNLRHFYDRGIRYITLAHGEANHICDSSYDPNRKWNGLSPFGESLIPEMNKLGIMIDISHVSDSTFYQVLEITKAPVIASHSSCRHFTPGFERNMNDDMIKKIGNNGGVVQITFGSYFISGDYQSKMTKMDKYLKEHNIDRWSKEGKEYYNQYVEENDINFGTVGDLVNHIDHVVKLTGIDHVGLGSDFDGVSALPEGVVDVSSFPNIIFELLKRGYTEKEIEKICSGNILRVWKEVEEISENGPK